MKSHVSIPKHMRSDSLPIFTLKLEDWCFYIALVGYLVWRIFQSSMLAFPDGSSLNSIIHFGLLALFALSCLGHIKLDVNFFVALILGLVGLLVKVLSGWFTAVDLAIICYSARRLDFSKLALVCLITICVSCSFIVVCSQLGLIEDYCEAMRDAQVRHSLGFLWCTYLSHYYLEIVLLYVYLRPNAHFSELIFLFIFNLYIFVMTGSRNSFLMATIALLFTLLYPYFANKGRVSKNKFPQKLMSYSYLLLTIICFALPLAYDPESSAWSKINTFSSNRLVQTQASLYKYGVKPLGQDITFVGNGLIVTSDGVKTDANINTSGDINMVDSSFVRLFILDGFIVASIILCLLTLSMKRIANHSTPVLWMIVLMIGLHSVLDPQLLSFQYNSFLFLFWNSAIEELEHQIKQAKAYFVSKKLH